MIKWVETKDHLADALIKKGASSSTRLMEAVRGSHLRHQLINCIYLKTYLDVTWDSQCDLEVGLNGLLLFF